VSEMINDHHERATVLSRTRCEYTNDNMLVCLVLSSTVLGARVGRTVDKRSPSLSVVGYLIC